MLLSTSNKYLFNDNFYESCKIFKDSGLVPNNLTEYERRQFKSKCSLFTLENSTAGLDPQSGSFKLYMLIRSKTLNVRKHKVELISPNQRDRILKENYEDILTSRNGRDSFYNKIAMKYINISRRYVFEWLQKQENYQLHVIQPKEKIYRPQDTTIVNQKMMIDLIDLSTLKGHNAKREYVLCAIDTFSKFAYCKAITKKKAVNVVNALKIILNENYQITKGYPLVIHSDNGSEFISNEYKNYLNSLKIKYIFGRIYTPTDQATIERFNKTIKYMIFSYLSLNNTKKYYTVLDSIVENYNNSIHSSIKATPKSIHKSNRNNEKQIQLVEDRIKLFADKNRELSILNIGDKVRISINTDPQVKKDKLFAKKYVNQWFSEIYKVSRRYNLNDVTKKTKYKLIMIKDAKGNDVNNEVTLTYSRDDLQVIK